MTIEGIEQVRVPDAAGRGPRILFVPVSSPIGIGEYMRSLFLARACAARFERADPRFVVSREAPYAQDVPYPAYLTPTSPTKHVAEVNAVVDAFRPEIVVFDASGRAGAIHLRVESSDESEEVIPAFAVGLSRTVLVSTMEEYQLHAFSAGGAAQWALRVSWPRLSGRLSEEIEAIRLTSSRSWISSSMRTQTPSSTSSGAAPR